jgi:hypothetical protein
MKKVTFGPAKIYAIYGQLVAGDKLRYSGDLRHFRPRSQ